MTRRLLTVVLHDGTEHDIELRAPDSTPLAEVYRRFAQEWGEPPPLQVPLPGTAVSLRRDPRLFVDGRALRSNRSLGGSALRDGARVNLGPSANPPPDGGTGELEVRVVAGDRAGWGFRFARGRRRRREVHVLCGPAIHVGVDGIAARIGPELTGSIDGLMLRLNGGGGVDVARVGDEPMAVDGRLLRPGRSRAREPIHGWAAYPWPMGSLLTVGESCLEFGPVADLVPGPERPEPDGTELVAAPLRRPGLPGPQERSVGSRRLIRLPGRRRPVSVPDAAVRARRELPDAAEIRSAAVNRTSRLWQRSPNDADFLLLRWGLRLPAAELSPGGRSADRPPAPDRTGTSAGPAPVDRPESGTGTAGSPTPTRSSAGRESAVRAASAPDEAPGPAREPRAGTAGVPAEPPAGLPDTPRRFPPPGPFDAPSSSPPRPVRVGPAPEAGGLHLPSLGVVGIAGPWDRALRTAAWYVAQAAVLHSPEDVALRVLAADEGAPGWRWLRWLPRSSAAIDSRDRPRIYCGTARAAAQVRELLYLIDVRLRTRRTRRTQHPALVVILDRAQALRELPGADRLLRDGPRAGIYSLCVESEAQHLPPECAARVTVGAEAAWTGPDGARVPVLPDLVPWPWLEEVARALAPLRVEALAERPTQLPARRLRELLGLEPPDAEAVAARWAVAPRSTAAVVGVAQDGPFTLDLRRDGPHALVGGATGAGKTEFLRAWVASLAEANRPDELQFVLIDYKGGAAFGALDGLPHVTAVLADLDSRQVDRVLTRLGAALRARESTLNAHRAKNLEDYQALRDHDPALPPLPRLVFVVDEFAALVREFPELVDGLVTTALRGRSLGIHLVLATQRPSGLISPNLRAATNLRIALRTTGTEDSQDIIDAPDAAYISPTAPGRAFVRTGAEDLVEVQAARVTCTADPVPRVEISAMDDTGALRPSRSVPLPPDPDPDPDPDLDTDLAALTEAVREAARLLRVPEVPGPLPPPLPLVVTLSELPEPAAGGHDLAPVAFGLEEVADELVHRAAAYDLSLDTPLILAGGHRSGRSQFLRTLAAALARRHSTADVHLFGVDCDGGALQALAELPHCGAVVTPAQPQRLGRLLGRLVAAVHTRRELLATGGFRDIAAQRQAVPAPRRLPYLVLLLDGWESFHACSAALSDGRFAEDLALLMRDGGRVGVRCVITAGQHDLLGGALANNPQLLIEFPVRLAFELFDIPPAQGGEALNPGRALRGSTATEVQIALLDGVPTTRGQTDALDRLAAEVRERDADVPETRRPFRIEDTPRSADHFLVGAGKGRPVGREDVLAWLRDRHATGASAALLGPRRAGKTWVLEELSRRMVADGFRAVHQLTVPQPSAAVDSPDALAAILDREVRDAASPAEALLDKAESGTGSGRLMFLLDEVGRLAGYDAAAVSWLRDLGQAGAWLVYTGTEKDWRSVVRHALTSPGSSFGNDVNARVLGPLDPGAALDFLSGTAANLGVSLGRDTTAARIVEYVGTWPFYLQVAGDAVVRAVQGDDLSPLTDTSALNALLDQRLLDEWAHHFETRWAEIGPAGRAALLAAPGTMPTGASPAQRQDLRDVGLLRPGEQWLDDRPLLAWIARNAISLHDGESPA
ncbi:FtsK/SpoIIIE domain-containing protein [Streptomyces sp. HPF1205]|uniref:FtsK/SpoIIIE domain-containing protein n=1 Tax=Streptomyces sp. HPF1205 TaxID=2873262 RepID=UPI001CEC0487|nr:FtsK/SpoIIIE domain-containing protein [Streptomyces sp. HPF1205]